MNEIVRYTVNATDDKRQTDEASREQGTDARGPYRKLATRMRNMNMQRTLQHKTHTIECNSLYCNGSLSYF